MDITKEKFEFCAICLFGLESIVAGELKRLHIQPLKNETGRVFFEGGYRELMLASLWLRCAERILIRVGSFPAETFDMLFEGVRALPWEEYLPLDAGFPVKGHSVNSNLFSIPDCQSIIKKAVVRRMSEKHGVSWFEETGSKYQIQFSILKNVADVFIDTTGAALYKRGYRIEAGGAPIRETLAAAMVDISRFRGGRPFRDPFCGSGTIVIEAAMKAKNIAPGLKRLFAFEHWMQNPKQDTKALRSEAAEQIKKEPLDIEGMDIDPKMLDIARSNARRAGVFEDIRFVCGDARTPGFYTPDMVLITNPPYGERMLDLESAAKLILQFSKALPGKEESIYIISGDERLETHFGRRCDKKRKLYNGMLQCNLYMYYR